MKSSSRRFAVLGVGVASVVGLAVAALAAGLWPPGRVVYSGDDGPLRGATSRTRNIIAVDVGQPRSWAEVTVENPKDQNAIVDGFRTRPPIGGGIHLLASYVANDPHRKYGATGPLEGRVSAENLGQVVPVTGARVPHSDRGAALVLDVELTRPGLFWIEGVDIDFHIGRRKYTIQSEVGLVLCAPKAVHHDCPKFEERPSEGCATLGYVPFGANGCVPPSTASD